MPQPSNSLGGKPLDTFNVKTECSYILSTWDKQGRPPLVCGKKKRFKMRLDDDDNPTRVYNRFCDDHLQVVNDDEEL